MPENHDRPDLWIPDNPDGSGWARVRYGDKEGYCSTDYLIVS